MRRVILFLLLSLVCLGALPVATTWELRTLGNDSNGGCFVTGATGTDFSQQNAAQYTFTDLVLVTTATASSASHSFVAADVGNCIHITAGTGFTQGFYQIVSVAVGVLTADRAMGTMGSTAGTYAVGGALQVPATVNSNAVAGNRVFVKADGTYTFTSPLVINLNSASLPAYRWTGYTTVRTDNGRATWTTSTDTIHMVTSGASTPDNVEFDNFNFTNTASSRGDGFHATGSNAFSWGINNSIFDGFRNAVNGNFVDWLFNSLIIANSEIKNSTGHGITNSGPMAVVGTYVHNNGGSGIHVPTPPGIIGPLVFHNVISKSNAASGIEINNSTSQAIRPMPVLDSCVLMSNGANGLLVATSGSTVEGGLILWNTIAYGNTAWGINYNANPPGPLSSISNAYGANGSGNLQNVAAGVGDVTLSVDPFVSSSTNNFALNSAVGGGASLKGVGYPGVLTVGGTGHLDIGALQTAGAAGAGITTTVGVVQ